MRPVMVMISMAMIGCSGGGGVGGPPGPPAGSGNGEPGDGGEPSGSGGGEPRPGELTVEMVGFKGDQGEALVGLYRSAEGFPDDGSRAAQRLEVGIQDRRATATFSNLAPGRMAVAVLHDEDGDKKMKTGMFGRPKEGYGVSRDARARFGPPEFDDAAFELGAGENKSITIRMRY